MQFSLPFFHYLRLKVRFKQCLQMKALSNQKEVPNPFRFV